MGERIIKPIHNVFKQYIKVNLVNPYLFSKPFVSTWRTSNISTGSSTSTQIKLPLTLTGSYNFTVKWGDGTSNLITSWNQAQTTHTYSTSGDYTIEITGTCSGWRFNSGGDRLKLLSVNTWGSLKILNDTGCFSGCSNLNLSTVSDVLDITQTTTLYEFFRGCGSLTSVNKMNEWNFSTILNLGRVFYECSVFNQNLGVINIQNATAMDNMFYQCFLYNNGGSDSIKNWPVNNVTNFSATFYGCSAFNQPLLWVMNNATTTNGMFRACIAFNQNISSWNLSNNTDFGGMLYSCHAFQQNLGSWNVSNGLSFTNFMFGKTPSTFSTTNLDAIYNGWSSRPVKPGISISFGTAKRTAASTTGKAILTGAPNNWAITDGGI